MAECCFAEALAIFEKVSPIWLVGYTQTRLAQSIIWRLGQSNERAQHLLQNAHDVAVELENNWLHFYVEIISSRLWGGETQSNLYLSHLDKAIAAANQIGFKWGSGIATQKKANAAMKRVNRVLSKQTSNMAQYVARLLQHGLDSLPLGIDNEVKETAVAISHAIQYYEEVRQIFILIDDRLHADHALINLGEFCRHVGLFQRAIQHYERGIVSNKKHYDASFHAYCLMGLADIFLSVAELDSASAYFSQALSIFKSLEAREWDIAWSLNGLGDVAYAQGDYEQAQRYFKKSLEQFTKLDDDEGIALICQNLADTLHQMGDNERARMLYERSLPLCQIMNDEVGLGIYLFGMVKAKRAQQTAVWAATLLGAATNLLNANIGEPMPSFAQHEFDRYVATLQTEVDEAEFNTAWSNGQLLTVKAAITLAHK
ncbi:MAG: tetratricopeptide repeat protein [Chloroflexi bacterium]|nr:tetratricopeptide repeat protein [Chloroflexota bacterium]